MNGLSFLLGTGAGGWLTFLLPIGIIVIFIWFSSRSRKKQERQDAEMRDALAVGDEVTTIGGIIGKVVSVKGETFVLETTKDKTKIRFLKGAIRSVDVRAADLAAAVLEIKDEAEADDDNAPIVDLPEAPAGEAQQVSKRAKRKAKAKAKAEADAAVEAVAEAAPEAPAEDVASEG